MLFETRQYLRWGLGLIPLLMVLATGCGERAHAPAAGAAEGELRLISLAPSMTEIVYALGGGESLVGRTTACNYPPEVSSVPVIAAFGVPSMEALIATAPTHVMQTDLADKSLGAVFDKLGIERVICPARTLDEIGQTMATVATLVGTEVARQRVAEYQRKLSELRTRDAGVTNRPRVYMEIWHDPPMTCGSASFLSEMVRLAGGVSITDCVDQEFYAVSPEWIVAQDPDVIICTYMAEADSLEALMDQRGWRRLRAVSAGRVYGGLDNDIVLRPGPRVMEGIEALRACIVTQQKR
jgi:iron complex transport system substrate-binding protein